MSAKPCLPPVDPCRPGLAVAIGGALREDNLAVWRRLVQESGGQGARWAVFATASEEPERSAARIVAALAAAGALARVIPVAPRQQAFDWRALRDDRGLAAEVAAMAGVFFSGGAQELIVDALRPAGRESAMLLAIRQVFAAGGVVAGTSAGAAVMSEWMFRDAGDALAVLRGQLRDGQEIDRGFGFVDAQLLIDQHFLKRGRIGRLLPAMLAKGCRWGLGVAENSAALLRGGRIELIGKAMLADLGRMQPGASLQPFSVRGALLSHLDSGDVHELHSGLTLPAAARRSARVEAAAAGAGAGFCPDMLGDGVIAQAMLQLAHSTDAELRGLAFDGAGLRAGDTDAELGFEFRLHKGEDTETYGDGEEGMTVLRMGLDVRPVRLSHPLYSDWP